MLSEHAPQAIPFQIIGASIVVVAIWPQTPAVWLGLWWMLLTALIGYRLWFVMQSNKATGEPQITDSLQARFCLGVVATGVMWGIGYLFFATRISIEQAMLLMVLAGITAGGLVASYGIKHHFFGFLLPALGAPTIYGLYDGERIQIWISVLFIVFVVALIVRFRVRSLTCR